MADLAELIVKVDSRDVAKTRVELEKLTVAGTVTERKLSDSGRNITSNLSVMRLAYAAVGAVAVREAIRTADAYTNVSSRLEVATGSAVKAAAAQEELFKSAQRTRTAYLQTADLFAKLTTSTETLGISQGRLLSITETVNKAVTLSGASAQAAQASIVQFGQGLASGTLRGEELNSILEQTPALAKALGDGLGKPVGSLKKMGEQGQLTSKVIVDALESVEPKVSAAFSRVQVTVGQSMTVVGNSIGAAISELDKASGFTKTIATAILDLSANIDSARPGIRGLFDDIETGLADVTPYLEVLAALATVFVGGKAIMGVLKLAPKALAAGKAAMGSNAALGGFAAATVVVPGAAAYVTSQQAEVEAKKAAIAASRELQAEMSREEKRMAAMAEQNRTGTKVVREKTKEEEKAADVYAKLMGDIKSYNLELTTQIENGGELTRSQKLLNVATEKFGAGIPKAIRAEIDRAQALEATAYAYELLAEYNKEAAQDQQTLTEKIKENEKAYKDLNSQVFEQNEQIEKSNQSLASEIARIGLKTEALAELDAQTVELLANQARLAADEADRRGNDQLVSERTRQVELLEEQARLIRLKGSREAARDRTQLEQKANVEIVDNLVGLYKDFSKNGAKSFVEDLKEALKTGFEGYVLRIGAQALLGVNGAGEATGGGLLGSIGGSFLQSAVTKGFTSAIGSTAFGQGVAAAGTAGAGATGMFGAGQIVGAAGPYVAAAILAYNLFKKDKKPATTLGGADVLFSGQGQELSVNMGQGGDYNDFVKSLINPIKDQYTQLVASLGGVQQAFTLTGVGNTGRQGENPNFALKFGINNQTFGSGAEIALNEQNIAIEQMRTLVGLLAQTDLPDNIDAIVRGVNLGTAGFDELQTVLAQVNSLTEKKTQIEEAQSVNLAKFAAEAKTLNIELLKVQGQSEAAKVATRALAIEGLNELEIAAYDANQTIRDQIEETTQAARIADERAGLEQRLLELQGNTAELRARELAQLDATNRGYLQQIFAIEDAREAESKFQQARAEAQEKQNQALREQTELVQRLVGFGRQIKDFSNSLLLEISGSRAVSGVARSQFETQLGLARGGNEAALGNITQFASEAINRARSSSGSFVEFQRKALQIQRELDALPAVQAAQDEGLLLLAEIRDGVFNLNTTLETGVLQSFDALDASLDGLLSFDELKAAGLATDAEIARFIDKSDLNFDGLVSKFEVLSLATAQGFSKLDTTADGLLSFDELKAAGLATDAEIRNLTAVSDQNSDGLISKFELEFSRLVGESQAVRNAVATGFTRLDTTANGLLDFNEFSTGLAGIASDSVLREGFAMLDSNGDGVVNSIEATNARLDGLAVAIGQNLAPLFDQIDTNVSGGISRDEFTSAFGSFGLGEKLNSIFSEIDVNGDGTITRLEAGNSKTDTSNSLLYEVQQMALRSAGSGIYVRASTDDRWNDALYRIANRAEGAGGGTVVQGGQTNGTLSVTSFGRTGQPSYFAKGAAFTNSIIDRPTRFNIGEMGEAGPEAIMPLARGSDGRLGVEAKIYERVYNAEEGQSGGNAAVAERVDRLESTMKQTMLQVIKYTKRTAEQLDRWDGDGLPEERVL